jgi:hypothetical protein
METKELELENNLDVKQISGSVAVIDALLAENVATIFGYPGGAIMPIYDALYDYKKQLNHIFFLNENLEVRCELLLSYLKKLNLKDQKIALTFEDGKVNIKPFELKYQDAKVNIGGQHGFDQSMNYNLKFDVPAKYLGPEVNKLLAKLSPADVNKLENIPINALVTGNFKSPKISTDIKSGITNLTTQLVKQQKEKLIKQGTSALEDLIKTNTKTDTTKTKSPAKEDIKKKAGDLLNGLFRK